MSEARPTIGNGTRRRMVLLVGRDDVARAQLAALLIGRGHAVLVCSGPPNCSLAHADECVLASMADLLVVLPEWRTGEVNERYLEECARTVGRSIFAELPPFAPPPGAEIAGTHDPHVLAEHAHHRLASNGVAAAE